MSAPSEPTGTMDRARNLAPMTVAVPALALAAVLLVVAPWIGVVTSDDGSSTSAPVHSGWAAAVPLLVVVLLALSRRAVALAAVAGLGVFGLVRLIADLGVVIDPGETLRPELFGIQTLTANPLHITWAAWMLILADLLMLAAATVAGNVVADTLEPLGRWDAGRLDLDADTQVQGAAPLEPQQRPRLMRTSPSSVVGIIAATGYLAANLGEAYSDPLPVIRPGFTDIGLWGSMTAAAAGLLLAMAVLLSSALDAGTARGLLLGLGLGAAGPPLVVLLGSIGNSTASPSSLAWLALAGSALLVVAGLLRRDAVGQDQPAAAPGSSSDEATDAGNVDPSSLARWNLLLAIATLGAAVLALAAYLLPQAGFVFRSYLSNDPAAAAAVPDDGLTSAFAPAGSIYLLVSVLLLIVAVLLVIPRTRAWGRTALTLAWVPAVAAFLFAVQYVNQVRSPELVAGVVFQADTTFRSGLWLGLAATIASIAVGVLAPIVTGRADDAAGEDVSEIELADRAPWAHGIAGALSVLVFVGIGPQAWTSDLSSSAGLFAGADRTDFWALWVTAIAVIIAFWVAVKHARRDISLALFVTSAVVLLPRLVLTGDVRSQTGFNILTGFWLNIVLVIAVLVAGAMAWKLIGGPTWDRPAEPALPESGLRAGKAKGSKVSPAPASSGATGPKGKASPR